MYFENSERIKDISSKVNCSIFVMPDDIQIDIPQALILEPVEKSVITVDQVRDILKLVSSKQQTEQYVIVRPADKLSDVAANAFLKNLEEPGEKIHYVLITENPSKLLPTVLSRASIYFLRIKEDDGIRDDAKSKELAKKLITAKARDLPSIAEEITKTKKNVRAEALNVVGLAIEMLYKSYYITKKDVFIRKLPKFLALYENLEKNGHIKLHLVADLC